MFLKKKLEELIAKSKLTPTELAKQTKIQQTTISRLLTGNTTKPHPDTLDTLAKFFKVPASYFFEDNEELQKKDGDKFIKFNNTKEVLEYLMLKTGIINVTMLNKKTGVSLTSLHRILKGETEKSSIRNLQQLANYFNITLAQLRALEEIPVDKHKELTSLQKRLPVIDINKLNLWFNGDLKKSEIEEFMTTSKRLSGDKSFIIQIETNEFDPDFKKNTLIIVDTGLTPEKNDFVLCSIKGKDPFVYQLNITEKNMSVSIRKCGENDFISFTEKEIEFLGVVVQEIRNLRE